MDPKFWHERWEADQIGFHQGEINSYLSHHWGELGLPPGAPVFVPLCGKSLDMLWLREQGHPVLGVELSRKAVEAFFAENAIEASVNEREGMVEFSADQLVLYCGDLFDLTPADLGAIGAVYDRAALIALPEAMRRGYAEKMAQLLRPGAHILLVTMEYGEGALEGPPLQRDRGGGRRPLWRRLYH